MKKQKVNKQIDSNIVTLQGLVTKIFNKQVELLVEGDCVSSILPNALMQQKGAIGVGDLVETSAMPSGQYKLLNVLPRTTAFYRGNRRIEGEQLLIAANAQVVLAIVTADYLLHQAGYLEQAILSAKRFGMHPVIYISKWDCISEEAQVIITEKLKIYHETAEMVFTWTTPQANERFLQRIRGKSVVVVGDRGCGKTSLINRFLGELNSGATPNIQTGSTHTSVLYSAADGTLLIDTPGFRDFALQKITQTELEEVFPEIAVHAEKCSFRDCTHTHEDGCAVIEAVRTNQVTRERFDVYQKLIGTVSIAKPKIDYRRQACTESFPCKVCGVLIVPEGAGSQHRNHCPHCLSSIHVDNEPGDRSSLCHSIMEPVSVWVRKGGEWAIIHKCRVCGALSSNRIAADDNPMLLMSIAVKPLSAPPFPLTRLDEIANA